MKAFIAQPLQQQTPYIHQQFTQVSEELAGIDAIYGAMIVR